MYDRKQSTEEGFVLLGRGEDGPVEILALDAEEGSVLCIFDSRERAVAFARLNPEVRGGGWTLYEMGTEGLAGLLCDFAYVAVDPDPRPGSGKELVSALGFARSIKRRAGGGT